MANRIALFPGSFDPFTIGHQSVVLRAVNMFDKIVIAIGQNAKKDSFFKLEKRLEWIDIAFEDYPQVEVTKYEGLTVDFCKQINAHYILRGLRTSADFEYERAIAQVNKAMFNDIETVFLLTEPEHTAVTSTIVREVIRHNGNVDKFLPKGIQPQLSDRTGY